MCPLLLLDHAIPVSLLKSRIPLAVGLGAFLGHANNRMHGIDQRHTPDQGVHQKIPIRRLLPLQIENVNLVQHTSPLLPPLRVGIDPLNQPGLLGILFGNQVILPDVVLHELQQLPVIVNAHDRGCHFDLKFLTFQ